PREEGEEVQEKVDLRLRLHGPLPVEDVPSHVLRARERIRTADHEERRVQVVGHVVRVVVGEPYGPDELAERARRQRLREIPHEDVVADEDGAEEHQPRDRFSAPRAEAVDPEQPGLHPHSYVVLHATGPWVSPGPRGDRSDARAATTPLAARRRTPGRA